MTKVFVAEPSQYPLAKHYDWSKGIALNEEGKLLRDKSGKAIMERDLAKQMRREYKQELISQNGIKDGLKIFYHGHL